MSKNKTTFTHLISFAVTIGLLVQITATQRFNGRSEYGNCTERRAQCNPRLRQPCCNPTDVCINIDRTILNKFDYRCVKYAQLGDPCEHLSDCQAIIEGKCSEDGTCACNSFSSEYNNTICLYPTIREKMIPEIAVNYNFDSNMQLHYIKRDFRSQTGLNRKSRTKFGEYCNQNDDCSGANYPNLGFICDLVEEGNQAKVCKCPEREKFDVKTMSCKDRFIPKSIPIPPGNLATLNSRSCAEQGTTCTPWLPQPCCDPDDKCINLKRITINKFDYRCFKDAQIGDPCQHLSDCRAIIEGKCSEDGTCACNSFSLEYNNTICLYPTIKEKLKPEIAVNYNYNNNLREYQLIQGIRSQTGLNRQSRTKFGEYCNKNDDCLGPYYSNSGFICDAIAEGLSGKECKCPMEMWFNKTSFACEEVFEPFQIGSEYYEDPPEYWRTPYQ